MCKIPITAFLTCYTKDVNPIIISKTDTIASAKTIMKRRRIDHLPVLQDNRLVGMVTSKDIVEVILRPERIGRKSLAIDDTQDRLDIAISGILDKNIFTSNIDDTLQSVTDLMVSQNSTYCVIKSIDEDAELAKSKFTNLVKL